MVAPALFSSATEEWSTPQNLFARMHLEFRFVLDAAATEGNTKCPMFYSKAQNGLQQDWVRDGAGGTIWCNPPYGRKVTSLWVEKAFKESARGCTVVMLLPARPGTSYWHRYILGHNRVEVRFLPGRLKFGGAKNSAPFDSAVVIFRPT